MRNDKSLENGASQLDALFDVMTLERPSENEPTEWAVVDEDINADFVQQASSAKQRKAAQQASGLPYGFSMSNDGVYFTPEGTDEKAGTPMRIYSPLRVTAKSRERSSVDWGRVIEFNDADDVRHEWAMPAEMLVGDGVEMRRELARLGLEMAAGTAARNRLLEHLIQCKPEARARFIQQTGWFDQVFVMPDRTIGQGKEAVLYQSESKTACQYLQLGTLEQWRENVARLCIGNSRLVFAVSASFAGMILHHDARIGRCSFRGQ